MYLKLKVHPSSKEARVVRKSQDSFEIFVREKPIDGRATEAAMEHLCEFIRVPRSRMRLVRGATARNKIVEII